VKRKGVCYDVGRVIMGQDNRPDFNPIIAHRELEIIKNDLHCNAVRICGRDIERLVIAAEDALNQGMEVWFCPEMWDEVPQKTYEYVLTAAVAAEKLRERWPQSVVFSVGSELTLFMQGILKGGNFLHRVGNNPFKLMLTVLKLKAFGTHNKPLNAFLHMTTEGVRKVFHGKVAYASAPIEAVDWSLFDFVCLDYYRGKKNRDTYGERLARQFAFDKPVIITEVGLCTYRGAEQKGGRGFMIVDQKDPQRLNGDYIRDEALQSRELTDMLRVVDNGGVEGAFVFNFVSPTLPNRADPRYDLDMASYSLVKSYSDGKRGTSYPDMTWEPKESFRAVADYYANH
jgi:hypothetical protein